LGWLRPNENQLEVLMEYFDQAVTIEDLLIARPNMKITPHEGAFYAKWLSLG
jgi:hypothetical protein